MAKTKEAKQARNVENTKPSTCKYRKKENSKKFIDLSRPHPRILTVNRRLYCKKFGKEWCDNMKKKIDEYYETPYGAKLKEKQLKEEKAKKDKKDKKKSKKDKKKPSKKTEKDNLRYIVLSKPRVIPKPPEVERGKTKSIKYFQSRLKIIMKPTKHNRYIEPSKRPSAQLIKMKQKRLQAALKYVASERIIEIAKPTPSVYVCDVKENIYDVNPRALCHIPSVRECQLAQPKEYDPTPCESRPNVNPKALQYVPSKRIEELAIPTKNECLPPREVPFRVSEAAKNAKASPRTEELAKPNDNSGTPPREVPWKVTEAAKNATASARTEEMAKPAPNLCPPPRKVPFEISKAALNAQASERTKKLALPFINYACVVDIMKEDMSNFHTHMFLYFEKPKTRYEQVFEWAQKRTKRLMKENDVKRKKLEKKYGIKWNVPCGQEFEKDKYDFLYEECVKSGRDKLRQEHFKLQQSMRKCYGSDWDDPTCQTTTYECLYKECVRMRKRLLLHKKLCPKYYEKYDQAMFDDQVYKLCSKDETKPKKKMRKKPEKKCDPSKWKAEENKNKKKEKIKLATCYCTKKYY